ncbi:MAG: hypothetical protein E7260_10080 [Lachnospiraceae bacterium]|nr:hypothetical protein [Lachnospiraceae bacterium]
MEEKFYEQFFDLEQGLENQGYVDLRREVKEELKKLDVNSLENLCYRIKLRLDKYEEGLNGVKMQPIVKLIFSPVVTVLITLVTAFFTFLNSVGAIFYQAGMETGENVVNVMETYGEIMFEMYKKGMVALCIFIVIVISIYAIAYMHDNLCQGKETRNKLYYTFLRGEIEEELQQRKQDGIDVRE